MWLSLTMEGDETVREWFILSDDERQFINGWYSAYLVGVTRHKDGEIVRCKLVDDGAAIKIRKSNQYEAPYGREYVVGGGQMFFHYLDGNRYWLAESNAPACIEVVLDY